MNYADLTAKEIKDIISKIKNPTYYNKEDEDTINDLLDKSCNIIKVKFFNECNPNDILTTTFDIDYDRNCPHFNNKCNKRCCNCENFVYHDLELRYGNRLAPTSSMCIAYCAKKKDI